MRGPKLSVYRGVSRCTHRSDRWQASVHIPGRGTHYIGTYGSEDEAARAYNLEVIRAFGDEAELNDVPPGPEPKRIERDWSAIKAKPRRPNVGLGTPLNPIIFEGVSSDPLRPERFIAEFEGRVLPGSYPTQWAAAQALNQAAWEAYGPDAVVSTRDGRRIRLGSTVLGLEEWCSKI